jgi:UDP-glucose 4-epimerase
MKNPHELEVLGDGQQKKSYLYVQDCIDAIFFSQAHFNEKVNIINLGANEYCQVNDSIGWITEHLGMKPTLSYTGGDRGWVGDNPFIFLDTSKLNKAGFKPRLNIKESVIKTLEYLVQNKWVLESRV